MSQAITRAWIEAREAPEHELRERYRATLETLYETLEDCGIAAELSELPTPRELCAGIEALCEERDQAAASCEELVDEKYALEEKLEKATEGKPDPEELRELRDELNRVKAENERLRAQVEAQETLAEDLRGAVGDVLAMSRRLTSLCQDAGIKPTHVRAVARRKAR